MNSSFTSADTRREHVSRYMAMGAERLWEKYALNEEGLKDARDLALKITSYIFAFAGAMSAFYLANKSLPSIKYIMGFPIAASIMASNVILSLEKRSQNIFTENILILACLEFSMGNHLDLNRIITVFSAICVLAIGVCMTGVVFGWSYATGIVLGSTIGLFDLTKMFSTISSSVITCFKRIKVG